MWIHWPRESLNLVSISLDVVYDTVEGREKVCGQDSARSFREHLVRPKRTKRWEPWCWALENLLFYPDVITDFHTACIGTIFSFKSSKISVRETLIKECNSMVDIYSHLFNDKEAVSGIHIRIPRLVKKFGFLLSQ